MKHCILIICATIISCTTTAKAQQTTTPDSLLIYLYRGSFNDALPEFEIKIYKSGRADYKGIKNTTIKGNVTTQVDEQEIEIFFGTAYAMSFFELQTSYTENFFAVEKAIIALYDNATGKHNKIMRRGKIPKPVNAMEDRIIKAVEQAIANDAAKKQ